METIDRLPGTGANKIEPSTKVRARPGVRPVFVVGCPRSGTTLLHHMILSSGDFAVFPMESGAFCYFGLKFPNLGSLRQRRRLLEFWLSSRWFAVSGLEPSSIQSRVLEECRNIGDFLRIVMEAMCRQQGVRRWAEKSPAHALYIPEIKRSIPDSLIVHIIRDGRDVALSLANFERISPFLWKGGQTLPALGVYWKWIVRRARSAGRQIGPDYYELNFEDLVQNPSATLAALGRFIDQDLDYERILRAGIGSVTQPESSFKGVSSSGDFKPLGRWKQKYSPPELAKFESLVGDCLEEFGYALSTQSADRRSGLARVFARAFYASQIESIHWLKGRRALRHFVGITRNQGRP
jgi:Sulfotransferase family